MILVALLPLCREAVVRNGSANSGMLGQLAVFTVRRAKMVLAAVLVLLGISIVFGGGVSDKLGVGGYTDPASESTKADEFLDHNFGTTSNLGHTGPPRPRHCRQPRGRGGRESGAAVRRDGAGGEGRQVIQGRFGY